MMAALFADGRMIDIAIMVLLTEMLLMLAWARWRGRLAALLPTLLPTLLSGLMLLLAWRATQAAQTWPWIAAPLLASGLAHGADLWLRTRRPG